MLFNSYEFLFLFLPLVLGCYFILLPRRWRLRFLTLVSYAFYGWWDWRFCSLMLISTLIDYQAGKRIYATQHRTVRRRWVAVSVVTNLSLLGFFKYFDLVASSINYVSAWFGVHAEPVLPLLNVVLPVGISFYTFQSMSYALDIYLGAAKPARNGWHFACYVALFPQLIAGPIVRYRDLALQLEQRTHSWAKASLGVQFFVAGLAKKVILADGVAGLVGLAFGADTPGFIAAWLGTLAYAMQIYFDFSGYSDMAVGLGLLLGFRLPQNFHSPYKAESITDFWRRWHISLSTWLRDYLYIPLGGNRRSACRTYVNLMLTMLLGGLWHGAHWNFVLWGGYHGAWLALERKWGKRGCWSSAPTGVRRGLTFLLVTVGWVFFRAESLQEIGTIFRGMLGLNGWGTGTLNALMMAPLSVSLLVLSAVLAFGTRNTWEMSWQPRWPAICCWVLLFLLSVGTVLVNTASPFLYFQF